MKSRQTVALLTRVLCILVLLAGITWLMYQNWFAKTLSYSEHTVALSNLRKQPLAFIENQGQWDSRVAYMARTQGMTAWLNKEGITFQFEKRNAKGHAQGVTIQMTFEGASELVSVEGAGLQLCKHHYFIGKDRSQWRSGVSSYAQVIYKNLYDDIDLHVHEKAGWLEYDMLLSEGAALSDVVIECEGINRLAIDENGILVMDTEFGPVTQQPPKAWYVLSAGDKLPVECVFRQIDDCRYGFEVPERDLALALVIDPGLEWSTFLGGSGYDEPLSMVLDINGNPIVTGVTEATDFPTTPGAYDTTYNGGTCDAFVSCLSATGAQLLWSTFLGGGGYDIMFDITFDSQNAIVVGGLTSSSNFPTSPTAFDTTHNGSYDGVVARLSSDGSALLNSTFIGSPAQDWMLSIEINGSGTIIAAGITGGATFPVTPGAYDTTYNGGRDVFVTGFNPDLSNLVFSTYLGGTSDENWPCYYPYSCDADWVDVKLTGTQEIIIAGMTYSPDFPTTTGVFDSTFNGSSDVFVTCFDDDASSLVFSTFVGGTSLDGHYHDALTIDNTGHIIVGGFTQSGDFPVTYGALDTTYNGYSDGFVFKLDPSGANLVYSSFIGGTTNTPDAVDDVIVDNAGIITLIGACADGMPITPGAFDTTHNGIQDGFIMRMNPDTNGIADLMYSSYLGASGWDWVIMTAPVNDSTVIVVGYVEASNFPVTPGAYDTTYDGVGDVYVARFGTYVGITEASNDPAIATLILGPVYPNPSRGQLTYNIHITHNTHVKVEISDITGRCVSELMDRRLAAGNHEFSWQPADGVASGTYFIQLRAGDRTETRKVLFIK